MKTESATRFSVSMPAGLVRQLDGMVQEKGYANRSQAVADMVRSQLVEHHGASGEGEIAGTVTLVYDHHRAHVQAMLTDVQHDHGQVIIATMHVHLDHNNCLEVLAMRGPAVEVKQVADSLITAKGVKHGKLTVTTTGHDLHG